MKAVVTVEGVSGEYYTSPTVRSGAFHFYFDIPRHDRVGKQLARVFRRDRNCYYSLRLIGDDRSVIGEFGNIPLYVPAEPFGNGVWLMHQRMDVYAD